MQIISLKKERINIRPEINKIENRMNEENKWKQSCFALKNNIIDMAVTLKVAHTFLTHNPTARNCSWFFSTVYIILALCIIVNNYKQPK